MLVAAICNQKGGVGKTTTTVNLARAAHLRSWPTLVADLDPQAATTKALLGIAPDPADETVADALSARSTATVADVVRETRWKGVDVLPSGGPVLADVAGELVTMGAGREHRLSEGLRMLTEAPGLEYALVLIDCPPSLDLLTVNALTATHRAVIVTHAGLLSVDGISDLMTTVRAVQRYANSALAVAGVIVNQLEERTRRGRHWLGELTEHAPAPVWSPTVRKATCIADALEVGAGLDEWGTPEATVLAEIYDRYLTYLTQGATA